MNLMERILDKAERDGTLRPITSGTAPAASPRPTAAQTGPARPAPQVEGPRPAAVTTAPPTRAGAPVAVPAAPAIRTAPDVRLDPALVVVTAPDGAVAEQFRAIRTRILHVDHGVAIHTLLVTSPSRGDGKSVTAANLALTMARAYEHRVCLVDTDFRTPGLHRLLGLPVDAPGLSDVLAGHVGLEEALTRLEAHDLTVLPAGGCPPRPSELLATSAMRRTLDALRSRFDCIILDAPAVVPLSDVGALAPLVDSTVLVVRTGVTAKSAIREATAVLGTEHLLGVIVNGEES